MGIKLKEITFIEQFNDGVIAVYKDCTVSVSLYRSYQLNRQEAVRQLNSIFAISMKTLTKDNFKAAMAAFVEGQDEDKDEHYASDAGLAESYLTAFYNEYFEVDLDKDARRAEYLKLKEEFGDE